MKITKDEPQIKEVLFRPVTDFNAATIAFESGEIDVLTKANIADEDRLIDDPNYSSVIYYRGAHQGVTINNQAPRLTICGFARPSTTLDKEAINAIVTEGTFNTDIITRTGVKGEGYKEAYEAGRLTEYEYNIDKARDLMQEAGYDEDNPLHTSHW